jgi:hypothetical protein
VSEVFPDIINDENKATRGTGCIEEVPTLKLQIDYKGHFQNAPCFDLIIVTPPKTMHEFNPQSHMMMV